MRFGIIICAAFALLVAGCGDDGGIDEDPRCGDGTLDPGEVCDDGNNLNGDGCSADCQSDETCGNGIVDTSVGEICDDGNNTSGDGCSADCLSDETCGNNIVDVGEECDDGNTEDGDGCSAACQYECSPALDVQDDGTGENDAVGLPDLVLSEVSPGEYVELWNTTDEDIALADVGYQLCSRPGYAPLNLLGADVVVPAGGYATVPWPETFNLDTDERGEMALYLDTEWGNGTKILDFMCWGEGDRPTRQTEAESVGKWDGACAPALEAGAIHRRVSTGGTVAADYDAAAPPAPQTCVAP